MAMTRGKSIAEVKKEEKVVVAKVEKFGDKLIVPEGMKLEDAAQVIQRAMAADEKIVTLSEEFNCFLYEGCYALKLALEELYGWVDVQPTPDFFGDIPPELVGVVINERGDVVQVPWGRFLCPVIPKEDGFLQSSMWPDNPKAIGLRRFKLYAEIRQKYKDEFKKLCTCIREKLREHSIYKGKAIAIRFTNPSTGLPEPFPKPEFIRLDGITKDNLILPERVHRAVQANLFTPIEKTNKVRDAGISLKSGVLLAGDYGTGKTMAAYISAKLAVDNGHTFIYCKDIREFAYVVSFAQYYAETGKIAVVFCEDIDKAFTGERNISMDQILNIMDGVDSKRYEVLTIFTTNDVGKINQAAIRPGRLDAIIHVERPDNKAAERLVRLYAGKSLNPKVDLMEVGDALAGQIPSVIMECVQRAKRYAISLGQDADNLTADAILASVETMKMQLDLLSEHREPTISDMALFGGFMGRQVADAIKCGMLGVGLVTGSTQSEAAAISKVVDALKENSKKQLSEG